MAVYDFPPAAVKRLEEIYSKGRVESILGSLKTPAGRYFLRVNTLKATPSEVVEELKAQGFCTHVYERVPDAIYLPVSGPFPVRRLERVVVAKKDAAESVYQGAHLYAPGVLDARGVREGDEVSIVSPRGHLVAEGVAVMDGEEMVARKQGLAVEVKASVYRVPSIRELDIFKEGLVYDQSLPAIVAGHILNPQPGWLVVDMCAAPGGKATHAAQLMRDEGKVVAIDRSRGKATKVADNARRLGLSIVEVRVADSRYVDLEMEDVRGADAVILDPPCSAIGVRPTLYYEREDATLRSLSEYQRQFLKAAAGILRRGGLLLYSTCTLTLEENEHNVLWAIRELGFRLREQRIFLGSAGFTEVGKLTQRFEPDLHDTPGFFIALLEKV